MARLLEWINGLAVVARSPLSGPRSVGGASNESIGGFVQTVASALGAWRWSMTVRPMRGRLFRLYRGMVTALHGGANAVRVPFCDPDIMSWEESGVDATPAEIKAGATWSNGQSWSNGENWGIGRPWATVDAVAAKGDTLITLADEYWGHELLGGEWLGFVPFHFGLYIVTEVLGDGEYRIWPPLRKALTVDPACYATLRPVMAMRLESEQAATANRGRVLADSNTLTLVEVQDEDVRNFFED